MSVLIGVSCDLLGTLLTVYPSSGHQYAIDISRFLDRKGITSVTLNEQKLQENFSRAMKRELARDRAIWVEQGKGLPKEMPIGGTTEESVMNFWCRILDSIYDTKGYFCDHSDTVLSCVSESRQNGEWRGFMESVVRRFGSPEPYRWLPSALASLKSLQEWRETGLPPGIQCSPPAILTNCDRRLLSVIREMSLHDGNPDLLGPLVSADTVGIGKPSPNGIKVAMEASGVVSASHWLHLGDADEDEEAARRAGCHFLRCSPTEGVEWGSLHGKLQNISLDALKSSEGVKFSTGSSV